MRHLILIVLGLLCFSEMLAQDVPQLGPIVTIFKHKKDSIEFAQLDARLSSITDKSTKASTMDSAMYVRMDFLKGKKYTQRMIFKQNASFTPYQNLPAITNLDSITKISVLGKGRRKLPDSLYLYKNLQTVELIGFKITRLPKELKAERVILYGNLPSRRLKLSKNTTIKELRIRGDERGRIPKRYDRLKSLQVLQLSRNGIKKFPNVKGCDSLKTLDLNNNNISKISPVIAKLTRLENISLYRNEVKEIPDFFYSMKSLHIIDFYYNHLTYISPAIANLKNLEIVYFANNELTALPDEIGELKNLWALYIHHNRLKSLPLSIKNMTSLSILRVNHNHLTEWPDGLSALKELSNFDCSFNMLHQIPVADLHFPNLKLIALNGNAWDPKVKLELKAWATELEENGTVVILEGLMLNN